MSPSPFITIGRHRFSDRQIELLRKIGLTDEVARVETVTNVSDVIKLAQERGAKAIVVQGLPLPILAQLLAEASRAGIAVFGFETEPVTDENVADIKLPSQEGKMRLLRTKAVVRFVKIEVVKEVVAE